MQTTSILTIWWWHTPWHAGVWSLLYL